MKSASLWAMLTAALMSAEIHTAVLAAEVSASEPATLGKSAPHEMTSADVNTWLDGFMPNALVNADIAGAVVTIVKGGEVLVNRGFGFSNLAKRTPVDPERTLFRPGSISKLFTWTAVMQLAEQGRVDLDANVEKYLDFKLEGIGAPVTLRHIMTHTTGFEEVLRNLIIPHPAPAITLEDYVKKQIPRQIYAPGTMPAYSNYATALAGYVVQRVSGEPFAEYVKNHITGPLGMESSTFQQPLPSELEPLMSGGYRNVKANVPRPFEIVPAAPAGALSSTGSDMARFMIAHLNHGAGLLKPETSEQMMETIDRQFPGVNSMALGFYRADLLGHRILSHGGDTGLFHSDLALMMDENVGVFLSLNSGGAQHWGAQLLRWQLMKGFVTRYFSTEATVAGKPLPTALEHGRAMVGVYESARRAEKSPFVLLTLLGQQPLTMEANGDLVGLGLPDANGERKRWREVEPWVWQAVNSHERMGARVEEGRVTALGVEPLAFAIPYMRAPWWRQTTWLMPVFAASVVVFALTFLAWPLTALVRRNFGAPYPYQGPRALADRIVKMTSAAMLVYVGAWAGFLLTVVSALTRSSGDGRSVALGMLYTLGIVPLIAPFALIYVNVSLRQVPSSRFAKFWAALLMLSALVVLWAAIVLNFFSFAFRY